MEPKEPQNNPKTAKVSQLERLYRLIQKLASQNESEMVELRQLKQRAFIQLDMKDGEMQALIAKLQAQERIKVYLLGAFAYIDPNV